MSRWSSVEPQEFEEVAILHRLRRKRLNSTPEHIGQREIFVLNRLELRRRLHFEQGRFLEPAAADDVEVAESARRASSPTAAL